MAMLQLGKLKFRFKDGGLDFRWGEGKKMRIGKKSPMEQVDDYADDYMDYEEDADLNYDGRFADDQDYPEDDYADDGYDAYEDEGDYGGYADDDDYDGSYDDSYDDAGYDDAGYDDYADDGYGDQGYDDGYADDYDEEYDDRYSDEDASDSYDGDGYEDYDEDGYEGYDDGYDEYPEGGFGTLLQYVDENDWVTYLLLVLLPPLGIYLLWRRQRFEPVVRYAVSAASAVWFVVMIVLLATLILKGSDMTDQPPVPTLAPTPVVNVAASPSPSASAAPNSTLAGVAPAATPIGGGLSANSVDANSVVWASTAGNFYHKSNTCSLAGGSLSQITLENAKNRGKYACPECYGGTLYYATAGGQHYHLDDNCSNMDDAEMYTKEMAEAEKKSACPVCVTKTQKTLDEVSGNVKLISSSTKDKSGIKVWCTSGGVNYHMTKNCRGMSGASQVTLSEALLKGKTACQTCCAVSGNSVYCTKNGTYYHRTSNCSGMSGASKVTIAEALVLGKKECPSCRPVANSSTGSSSSSSSGSGSSGSSSSGSSASSGSSSDAYYVYATSGGKYYHVKQNCSGMSGAKRVTLQSMINAGRAACPECCGGAGMSVYATKGGTYYHSYATCSDMSNASKGTLAHALAMGYKRCPRCWGSTGSTASSGSSAAQSGSTTTSSSSNKNSGSSAATATGNSVMVYATKNGKWYHTKSNCSGMKGASKITLNQAMAAGKTACATCASTAQKTVYSNKGGKYYHKASSCDNMSGATKRTLAEALQMGQTACPTCMLAKSGSGSSGSNGSSGSAGTVKKVANYSVGKSGIKVYASPSHKYYHTKSSCSGVSGLSHVALETALNYGRTACPKCADTASEKVYATKNGKYYHISKSCAGSGASSGTLANALAYGFSPCPYCVTGTKTNSPTKVSNTYESGRSGIKVYAKASGKYYHTKQSCAGSGSVKVTLETALNYGKRACSECCAVADRTVYAVKGYFYYHASKSCAGSNAVKGNYAQALAYGLRACPNCIGGSSGSGGSSSKPAPTAGPAYSASADSSVYINLYSSQFYYHKASKCSGSGTSGGTEVTLEYAKDFGYKRCPYCNPASSIG